jgi:ATP adenylyltransferase
MDKLWAPWRMDYILGDDEEKCFLCRILAEDNDRENLLLKRGRRCGVVMNRFPYNNGHLMIFPHRHVAEVGEMNADERLESMDLVAEVLDAFKESMRPDGFNVGLNLGRAGGAGLEEHIHLHVVPRWNGDTNFMPVIGDTKVIPQALMQLWDQLHPLLDA